MIDDLVPFVFFITIGLCVIIPFYLRYLSRVKELDTLSKLAEGNLEIRADLIKLIQRPSLPRNDLRKGLVLVALAIPIIIGGLVEGKLIVSIVLGGIPLLVGLAYIYMAKSARTAERDLAN